MAVPVVATIDYVILPAIMLGLVIGFIELIFVHMDEAGMGWVTHAAHAIPVTIIFTFITMNVPWVLSLLATKAGINIASNAMTELGVIILIGIIAMVKTMAAAAIAGRTVGEKKIHIIIIGILIVAAPYAWKFFLKAIIGRYLPF